MPSRKLPENIEAEKAVLGAALMDPDKASLALAILRPECFSDTDPRNRLIFEAMVSLNDKRKPVDIQLVVEELNVRHTYEDAGGIDYLNELVETYISPEFVDHYISVVKNEFILRSYLLEIAKIQKQYNDGKVEDISKFLQDSELALKTITDQKSVGKFKTAREVTKMVSDRMAIEAKSGGKSLIGVDTGYTRLNKYTHGWQAGQLIILGARPALGKTAFALNLAYNAAKYFRDTGKNKKVAVFSCEMSNVQIMQRLVSMASGVNGEFIQTGRVMGRDAIRVQEAFEELSSLPMYFDDTSNPLLGDVVAKARQLQDVGIIIIDYLNLLTVGGNVESRQREISIITMTLKELARTLEIPVIALAQVSRDATKNDNNVPTLTNLKESGSIEQDADVVMLMHREDYYTGLGQNGPKKEERSNFQRGGDYSSQDEPVARFGKDKYTKDLQNQVNASKAANLDKANTSVVEIIIAKNRAGKVGLTTLMFEKNYSRFTNSSLDLERTVLQSKGIPMDED